MSEAVMDDNVSVFEWPYFVWQMEGFSSIRREIKYNCLVRGKLFKFIFERNCSKVFGDEFRICVEEVPQKLAEEDAQNILSFNVRTHIPVKHESEKKLFLQSADVVFRGISTPQCVWRYKADEFLNMSVVKELNDKVSFICMFEPRRDSEIYQESTTSWFSLEALSRDLRSLQNTEGDVAWNKKKVHRVVVEARCPQFLSKAPDSSDLDGKCLDLFVNYIYCGRLPEMHFKEAQILYKFGSKYNLKDLMNLCSRILTIYLEEENVYDLLSLAHNSKDKELIKFITEYILQEGILKCDKWLIFAKENKELALEVYRIHAEQN